MEDAPGSENRSLFLRKQLLELLQVRGGNIGDGAVEEAVLLPGKPMIALYLAIARQCSGVLKFGDKNTDDMLAPAVDESGDRAAVEHVEAPSEQWEPGSGKIAHGWREIHPAVEPRLYRVLVRGFHVRQVPRLKRAKVRIDGCDRQRFLSNPRGRDEDLSSQESCEEQASGQGKPTDRGWFSFRGRSGRGQGGQNFASQTERSPRVETGLLEGRSKQVRGGNGRGTVDTGFGCYSKLAVPAASSSPST